MPEYDKKEKSSSLYVELARWSPKHRKVGIPGIIGNDGTCHQDADTASDVLSSHWAKVFSEQVIDQQLASEFLEKHSKEFPKLNWILSFEQFVGRLCL